MCDTVCVRHIILIVAFVTLIVLDLTGVFWLVGIGGLGAVFALSGHGGMWVPSLIIGAVVDAILLWLTFIVGRRLGVGR
jgi:hypothetical protein